MDLSELSLAPLLRAARHHRDVSQRELAAASGVSLRTIAAIEAGTVASPRFDVVQRLLAAAECRLRVEDADGQELTALAWESSGDRGGRAWPAHLDMVRLYSWRDLPMSRRYLGPLPQYTFRRLRDVRDEERLADRDVVMPALPPLVDTKVDVLVGPLVVLAFVPTVDAVLLVSGPSARSTRVHVRVGDDDHVSRLVWLNGKACFVVSSQMADSGLRPESSPVTVLLALDDSTPADAPPADLRAALDATAGGRAGAVFDRLPPSHRTAYVRWVLAARTAQVRQRRVRSVCRALAA